MRQTALQRLLLFAFLACLSVLQSVQAQTIQAITMTNTVWRYNQSNNLDQVTWMNPEYDDSGWQSGLGLLSSDTGNAVVNALIHTVLNGPRVPAEGVALHAYYFRTHFQFDSSVPAGTTLDFKVRVDDGVVFFLNGTEIRRLQVADTMPIAFASTASGLVPCANSDAECDLLFAIDGSAALRQGDNVLAAIVFQPGDSSDVSFGASLDIVIPRAPTITNANSPTNAVVLQNRSHTLFVYADGVPAMTYQWFKDTQPILDATNATYSITNMTAADTGQYYAVVSNVVGTTNSRTAVITYSEDSTPPTISSVMGTADLTKFIVNYSEAVEQSTAEDTANYQISGGAAAPMSAVLSANRRSVTVTLDTALTENTLYTVTVNTVQDLVGLPIEPDSTAQFRTWVNSACSGLLFEYYNTGGGASPISLLTNHPSYPNNPTEVYRLTVSFNTREVFTTDTHENYGGRVRGVFIPPASGNWKFYLRSDDSSELWFNANGANANGKVKIAEQTGCCNAYTEDPGRLSSFPLPLEAGQAYYIEALYKEGGGGDYCEVAAKMDTDSTPPGSLTAIPASMFGYPASPPGIGGIVALVRQPASVTNEAATPVSLSVVVTNEFGLPVCVQWQRSDDGGQNFADIPGATSLSYFIPYPTVADDNGDQYRVTVSGIGGLSLVSDVATLAIQPDTTKPRIRRVVGINTTNIAVLLTERLLDSTLDPLNFAIDDPNLGIAAAQTNATNPLRLDLIVGPTPMTLGQTYTLTLYGASSPGGNGLADPSGNSTDPDPTTVQFTAVDFGTGDPEAIKVLPVTGRLPVDALSQRGFDARFYMIGQNINNDTETSEQVLSGHYTNATGQVLPNLATVQYLVITNWINYTNTAGGGRLVEDMPFPGVTSAVDNVVLEAIAYVKLVRGLNRMAVNSDDGFRVTLVDTNDFQTPLFVLGEYSGGRGVTDTVFDILVEEDGLYPLRLTYEEGTGDAAVEWWRQDLITGAYSGVNDEVMPAYRVPAVGLLLAYVRNGNNLVISWPTSAVGFGLQVSTTLQPGSWTWATPVVTSGATRSLTVPLGTGQQSYYRLVRQ